MVTPIVSSNYRHLYQLWYVKYLVLIRMEIYSYWTTLVVLEVR